MTEKPKKTIHLAYDIVESVKENLEKSYEYTEHNHGECKKGCPSPLSDPELVVKVCTDVGLGLHMFAKALDHEFHDIFDYILN